MKRFGFGYGFGISGSRYWNPQKDRSLFYTSRSGLDLLETGSGSNLNAKILPTCGVIDATHYTTLAINNFRASDNTGFIEIRYYQPNSNATFYLFTTSITVGNTCSLEINVTSKAPKLNVLGTGINNQLTGSALSVGWHTIRWGSTGSAYTYSVDGQTIAVGVGFGNNDGKWLNDANLANARVNISIGALLKATPAYSAVAFNIDYVNYSDTNKWIFTGVNYKLYDVIGTTHMNWVGAAPHFDYDIGASTLLLDSGFSVWTKAGSPNEYVPYKAGAPYNIGAVLTGYSKLSDHPGGVGIYNYAPSLVDFDYLDSVNASLVAFDKSNSTHHIATASMGYYDAANVYRWRQDELESPVIYSDTYKNVGYKAFWMIKGTVVSPNVIDMSELLLYTKDQIKDKEWGLAQYCTLQDIVVQSEGKPVYDGDNYLTWI